MKLIVSLTVALICCPFVQNGLRAADPQDKGKFRVRPSADWTVTADPPKEPITIPQDLPYRELIAPIPTKIVYPPGLTAYLAVGMGLGNFEAFAIGDLRTGKVIGKARGLNLRVERLSVGGPTLSTDGAFLAFFDSEKKAVLVINVKIRKATIVLNLDDSRAALFFPTLDQLLAVPTSGKSPAKLWKLPSGKLLQSFPVVANPSEETGRTACSPGGRYLAIASEGSLPQTVYFYDLTNGKKAGFLNAPGATKDLKPWFTALAFSPNGSEFAAYLDGVPVGMNAGQAMACWDLTSGQLVSEPVLDQGNRGRLTTVTPEPLQWFPDGKGWLLGQLYVIDRAAGAVVQTVEAGGDPFGYFGTKVLDDRRVLTTTADGKLKPVEVKRTVR
jgi:hypothetical protein